jgi:hypothetical protein
MVTGYGVDGRGSIPGRGQRFFSSPQFLDHPASYSMGTGGDFPWVKRPEREADYSHPSSAEVKSGGAISALPVRLYSVVVIYNFTVYLLLTKSAIPLVLMNIFAVCTQIVYMGKSHLYVRPHTSSRVPLDGF